MQDPLLGTLDMRGQVPSRPWNYMRALKKPPYIESPMSTCHYFGVTSWAGSSKIIFLLLDLLASSANNDVQHYWSTDQGCDGIQRKCKSGLGQVADKIAHQ